MLEFMDRTAINAVEDAMKMGLDRDAAAMLIARSDAPGPYAAAEAETMAQACRDAGAVEVFHTDDADEGEAFCAARRFAIPRSNAWATCCSRTSASRCRSFPRW